MEHDEAVVLGAVSRGARGFGKIRSATGLDPEKVNAALERLERGGLVEVAEKKGWLGKKVEITATDRGRSAIEAEVSGMRAEWDKMVALYKGGDRDGLRGMMDGRRGLLPTMMFFGVMDMMMFSMMFSMMGASMGDYVPADQVPPGADGGGAGDGGSSGDAGGDGGGFDFDIGF